MRLMHAVEIRPRPSGSMNGALPVSGFPFGFEKTTSMKRTTLKRRVGSIGKP